MTKKSDVFPSPSHAEARAMFPSGSPLPQAVDVMLSRPFPPAWIDIGQNRFPAKPHGPVGRAAYRRLEFHGQEICHQSGFDLVPGKEIAVEKTVLRIRGCRDFSISWQQEQTRGHDGEKFCFEITDSQTFTLENIRITGGRNVFLIAGCTNFSIRNCTLRQGDGFGIIIHNSNSFSVLDCHFHDMLAAGIMITGSSSRGLVSGCLIRNCRGPHNCDAGIHLCATSKKVTRKMLPQECHEPLPILEKTERPELIVIEKCRLAGHRAQGIYLEGAVQCRIENNTISGNNKEGICCDWGSCSNILRENTVSFNGKRSGMTPEEIRIDFLDDYPLLPDGSCSMKLPGISLDNGAGNIITDNDIVCNYGGGVKMVRASFFNHITGNRIVNNAIGSNRHALFHGITFLGMGAVHGEFGGNRGKLLDFLPSRGNRVVGNIIRQHHLPWYHDRISHGNIFEENKTDMRGTFHRFSRRLLAALKSRLYRLRHWS